MDFEIQKLVGELLAKAFYRLPEKPHRVVPPIGKMQLVYFALTTKLENVAEHSATNHSAA